MGLYMGFVDNIGIATHALASILGKALPFTSTGSELKSGDAFNASSGVAGKVNLTAIKPRPGALYPV